MNRLSPISRAYTARLLRWISQCNPVYTLLSSFCIQFLSLLYFIIIILFCNTCMMKSPTTDTTYTTYTRIVKSYTKLLGNKFNLFSEIFHVYFIYCYRHKYIWLVYRSLLKYLYPTLGDSSWCIAWATLKPRGQRTLYDLYGTCPKATECRSLRVITKRNISKTGDFKIFFSAIHIRDLCDPLLVIWKCTACLEPRSRKSILLNARDVIRRKTARCDCESHDDI